MIRSKLIAFICILVLTIFLTQPTTNSAADNPVWRIVCLSEKKPCYVAANIKTGSGSVVSIFTIKKQKTKLRTINLASLQVPLGYHIPSGIKVIFNNNKIIQAKLIECNSKGCRAIFPLEAEHLAAMQKGDEVNILLTDTKTRKKLVLKYSLKGFSKTWANFDKPSRHQL